MSNSITAPVTVVIPAITTPVSAPSGSITEVVNVPTTQPFTITLNNGATGFILPLIAGPTYDFYVHWGDGTSDHITAWNQAEATHTYATNGQYKLWVDDGGSMPVWKFDSGGSCLKLLTIEAWGNIAWTSMNNAFKGCANLTSVASGGNFTSVTDFSGMLQNCFGLLSLGVLVVPAGTTFNSMCGSCAALPTFPAIQFPAGSTCSNLVNSCTLLTTIGAARFGNVAANTFLFCPALASVLATGINQTTSFLNCNMSAAALNILYGNLETVVGKTITVTGNPGEAASTKTIATAKGWTVVP